MSLDSVRNEENIFLSEIVNSDGQDLNATVIRASAGIKGSLQTVVFPSSKGRLPYIPSRVMFKHITTISESYQHNTQLCQSSFDLQEKYRRFIEINISRLSKIAKKKWGNNAYSTLILLRILAVLAVRVICFDDKLCQNALLKVQDKKWFQNILHQANTSNDIEQTKWLLAKLCSEAC